jgi:hypothetical protein
MTVNGKWFPTQLAHPPTSGRKDLDKDSNQLLLSPSMTIKL